MGDRRNLRKATEEITEWDWQIFEKLTSVELGEREIDLVARPERVFEQSDPVLAIHWHPETVPVPLAKKRIDALHPNARETLIIPTQHNEILTYGDFAGVELDCRAASFNRKVQLLLHFDRRKIEGAAVLQSMIGHTYRYRQNQLFEFLESMVNPRYEDRLRLAVKQTGTEAGLVHFARLLASKLTRMIELRSGQMPDTLLKNRLFIHYANAHRDFYDAHSIDRTVIFALGVKKIVKKLFRLDYFYDANEIIAETRALGGGVIVPHPEQFWPVLLADYDVDGYEVWNPQSREFTEFLIDVVIKKNRERAISDRRLLVMMGDDTHLSEKLLDPEKQNPDKADREIGYQPPWNDPAVRKALARGNFDKKTVIDEYLSRLAA
jgi:hypothetical protein